MFVKLGGRIFNTDQIRWLAETGGEIHPQITIHFVDTSAMTLSGETEASALKKINDALIQGRAAADKISRT